MRWISVVVSVAATVSCVPPSAWDMPPIIGAARDGDTTRIERLIREGADPNVQAGVNNWTPLEHAIHKNQEGSVRVLLAHGADVNGRGGAGVTPLIMAAGYGYTNIVKVLIQAGADPLLKSDDGRDALLAAMSGVPDIDRFTVGRCQTETVRAILEANHDASVEPGLWTRASALVAKFSGCEDVLKLVGQRREQRRDGYEHR